MSDLYWSLLHLKYTTYIWGLTTMTIINISIQFYVKTAVFKNPETDWQNSSFKIYILCYIRLV